MVRRRGLRKRLRRKVEVWKELLPCINLSELHRLICRLKRHASVLSYNHEQGKIALVLGYRTRRDRINSRVLLSTWVGKRRYSSVPILGLTRNRFISKRKPEVAKF